jgi:electron transfer flavoprotein-quinone oxidoreductase
VKRDFDVVVVGAGPAGAAAALVAARAGLSVCLLERGPFPGSKNMYGGVVYPRVLDALLPQWWEEAPVERWVTRRSTLMLTPTQSVALDFRTTAWGEPPHNGATALRPVFDRWLASKAVEAGATLVTATTATGLVRSGQRVVGVQTDREEGELRARLVVACDGVNSFLAREAGLYPGFAAKHLTLGAKEVLGFPRRVIEERFGLRDRQGADMEVVGCTRGLPGGGFIYTNLDSVAIGVVVSLVEHGRRGHRPEDLIADFKSHPSIAPLVQGGTLLEYSAHLIPEGGYKHMPGLCADGFLVAGDAAGMCLAAGLWLEGVNFAIGAGIAAGETAVEAISRGDTSRSGLAGYRSRLEASFVLADHKRFRHAPDLVLSDRVQVRYPALACGLFEDMFTVTNPVPKQGMLRLLRRQLRRQGIKWREVVQDGFRIWRTFG